MKKGDKGIIAGANPLYCIIESETNDKLSWFVSVWTSKADIGDYTKGGGEPVIFTKDKISAIS